MVSPCQHTCPVGVNIPRYVAHIKAGEYLEAVETIRERIPSGHLRTYLPSSL